MMDSVARCVALGAFAGIVACDAAVYESAEGPPGLSDVDSASVRILTDDRDGSSVPSLSLDESSPAIVIGAVEGDEPYLFSSVGDVVPLPGSGVAITDEESGEIRIFDAEGEFVRSFGALGDGPGEFRRLSGLSLVTPDTLVAWDDARYRFTWFGPDGDVLRTLTVDEPRGVWPPEGHALTSGAVVVLSHLVDGPSESAPGVYPRADSIIVRIIDDAQGPDTIGRFAGIDRALVLEELQPGFTLRDNVTIPFGYETVVRTVGDRMLLARNDSFEVRLFDSAGGLQEIWRFPRLQREVTSDEVDAFEDRFVQESNFRTAREQFGLLLDRFPPPALLPAFGDVIPAPDGSVWLADSLQESQSWWVLAPDGRLRGRVELPADFDVRAVGERSVFGVVVGALGVERVVRYDFEPQWGAGA